MKNGDARRDRESRSASREDAPDVVLSRRGFVQALAAGSVAIAAAGAPAVLARTSVRAPAKRSGAAGGAEPTRRQAAEIRKQKRDVEHTLHTIRDYKLPDGSDVAFVFVPRRARRSEEER
jgi:hypothetical protein